MWLTRGGQTRRLGYRLGYKLGKRLGQRRLAHRVVADEAGEVREEGAVEVEDVDDVAHQAAPRPQRRQQLGGWVFKRERGRELETT